MQKNKLQKILDEHKKWRNSGKKEGKRANLRDADLRDAYLRGADLFGAVLVRADLRGANLRDANLGGADLGSADLSYAVLRGASLAGAVLIGANLHDANLRGAVLHGAYLVDAKLAGATMPDGKKWDKYLKVSVPKLLKAGGKKLKDVATDEHWNCHDWDNCPMAAAFDVNDINHIPEKYRKDAATFVTLFDARLIPKPEV